MNPVDALRDIWQLAQLPEEALAFAQLTGADPVLASSFAVGMAAQVTVAAAALDVEDAADGAGLVAPTLRRIHE